jgi:sugar (pentulose or hexulose) kinase
VKSQAVLLADFGASRIKGALYHPGEDRILARAEEPAAEPQWGQGGEVEVDPRSFVPALERLFVRLAENGPLPAAVWLCTEMHGFLLEDGRGTPLTSYISWRDTRSTRVLPGESTSLHQRFASEIGDEYLRLTGMQLRPGTPFLGLLHLLRQGLNAASPRFLSLPEWIAVSGGGYSGKAHVTIAAASGLYDIERNEWSERLIGLVGKTIRFAEPSLDDGIRLGQIRLGERAFPLYGGYGDMQTAIHGAGVPHKAALAVNLGTGSQVARLDAGVPGVERRPFFRGARLGAITHIPCGRALNAFARMLGEQLWARLMTLSAAEIHAAPLRVDLNLFPGSWRFRNGGSISGLTEGSASGDALFASIALGWLQQYADAIGILDPERSEDQLLIAGGLARRCPAARPVLAALTGRRVLENEGDDDETLAGLAMLARRHAH